MVTVAALTIIPASPIMNHGSATASAPIRNVNTGVSRVATLCHATGSTSCLPSNLAYSSICLLKPATGLTASPAHTGVRFGRSVERDDPHLFPAPERFACQPNGQAVSSIKSHITRAACCSQSGPSCGRVVTGYHQGSCFSPSRPISLTVADDLAEAATFTVRWRIRDNA